MDLTKIKLTPLIDTLRFEKIDDAEYFSKKYSDYISNSRLGLINPEQNGSPMKYFTGFAGNKIYSDSLRFGSAIHMSQLQPELFELCDSVDLPTGKVGFIAELVYDKMKKNDNYYLLDDMLIEAAIEVDYYHGMLNEKQLANLRQKVHEYVKARYEFEQSYDGGKDVFYLSEKDKKRYNGCVDALNKNQRIQSLLRPTGLLEDPICGNETTILVDFKVEEEGKDPFIIKLKSKLDNFTIDKETNTIIVNDVKTTGFSTLKFNDSLLKYHYHREMAMYCSLLCMVAKKYYGIEKPTVKSNFLVVSTIPSQDTYYTRVVPMTRPLFLSGFAELRELIKRVAYYTSHSDEIESYELDLEENAQKYDFAV